TIIGNQPDARLVERARGLFASVLESPEGVRIQTIHGFSQSLLRRFPLEAGISPHFAVMDNATEKELLKEARMRLYSRAQVEDPALLESLHAIAHGMNELTLNKLLGEIVGHKSRFLSLLHSMGGMEAAIRRVYGQLGVVPGATLAA